LNPAEAGEREDQGPSLEDAEKLFDWLITSSLESVMAKLAPPPTLEVSPAPAPHAEAGGNAVAGAIVETPKDKRPERTTLAPAAPSPTRPGSRGIRGCR
jgi:hypothetical protein